MINYQQKSGPKRRIKPTEKILGIQILIRWLVEKGVINSIQQLTNKLSDILTDPPKYKEYQRDLAKYAWKQAGILDTGEL